MKADSKPYNFLKAPVLVIGDLVSDAHHVMEYGGISGETGGALGIHKETRITWGGAGLLVRNILALGGTVTFLTVNYETPSHQSFPSTLNHPQFSEVSTKVIFS